MSARTVVALMTSLVAAGCTSAVEIPPGVAPRLGPDEGVAVLSVFSEKHEIIVTLSSESMFFRYRLPSHAGGTTVRAVRLPAGRYHWSTITMYPSALVAEVDKYAQHDGSEFVVEAGKTTCPRTLIFTGEALLWRVGRTLMWRRPELSFVNQGTKVLRVLARDHAALLAQPLTLGGEFPDPFLEFWAREKVEPAAVSP